MPRAKGLGIMLCVAASSCSSGGTSSGDANPTPPAPTSRPVGSALVRAIEANDTPAAMALIRSKQGLDDRIGTRRTPVTAAIETGNVEVLRALIAAGAPFDPVASAGEYVGLAAACGRWPMFDFVRSVCPMLTRRSAGDRTALQCLAFGNRTQTQPDADRIAIALIDGGVDPHFCGEGVRAYPKFAPLPMAAMHPYRASLVKTLLDRVDFSPAEIDLALAVAAKTGAVESIVMLQRARTDRRMPPPSTQALCDTAGRYDTSAAIEILIAAGVDVNAKQKKLGRAALHLSVASGDLAGVQTLLGRGADPAALDAEGQSCLDLAATRIAHGREMLSDSPIPGYVHETTGRESEGSAVRAALQAHFAEHQDAAARLQSAIRARPRITSTPAATPTAAIEAIAAARRNGDLNAVKALVLLPDDPSRRLTILRRIEITSPLDSELPQPRLKRIEQFDSVAVAHVVATGMLASSRETRFYDVPTVLVIARRSGRWLTAVDSTAGGGLTPAELKAIEPAMKAERNRRPPDDFFTPGSK